MSSRRRVASACHSCMVLLAIVVIFVADNGAAKRGCAMFGHSCYGGHGKRSFQASVQQQQQQQQQQRQQQPPARDWPATSEEETQIDEAINKYFQIKSSSPHYTPFWQKWVQMYNDRKTDHPDNDNM